MGFQNGNNRPSYPRASSKKQPSASDVQSSTRCSQNKMRPITPQKQNKTPNKSGLTPIRPTKSPGPGVKLKSGLTPIKPTVSNVPHKSPFQKERTKLKSGLAPIRPSGFELRPPPSELDGSVLMARRKSGLLPVRPGVSSQNFGTNGIERQRVNLDVSHNVSISSHSKPFNLPSKPANSINEPNFQNGFRRKSGLLPIKPPGGALSGHDPQQRKPRLSVANLPTRPVIQSQSQSRFRPNVQASLNAISEDRESPTSSGSNLSGLVPFDDGEDMSVVIKHKKGQGSSRVPLPRASLSSSHFTTSDNDTSVCRIPKRVLHFDDDDLTTHNRNVLKDKSSRMNVIQEKIKSPPKENDVNLSSKPETMRTREALLKRKKEIEDTMNKLNNELEEINLQLKLHDVKITPNTLDDSENHTPKSCEDDLDSPFANVNSPCSIDPIELLPPDKSKRPENIYKLFRQSCSFLKTPQPSAFSKDQRYSRREPSNVTETPMNVSHRVQQQLADLFSNS